MSNKELLLEKKLIHEMEAKYRDYLSDESNLQGQANSISFPESEEEIRRICREMKEAGLQVTIQGGKTGLVGGSVPAGGHLMNLSKMNSVKEFRISETGIPLITVEPGVTLNELNRVIDRLDHKPKLFWPPDPTEPMATIGGIASCEARGSRAYLYGDTKEHIAAIRVMDANGNFQDIRRGEKQIEFYGERVDLLDFYLGSEGLYGIITEITLKLMPKPSVMWAIVFFFKDKADSFHFAELVRETTSGNNAANIAAMEYFDRATIDLVKSQKRSMSKIKNLPDVAAEFKAMVYVEIHGLEEDAVETIAEELVAKLVQCKGDPDQTWALIGENEVEKIHAFRHAAPEAVNQIIAKVHHKYSEITKLSTDMVLPSKGVNDLVAAYENDMRQADLSGCIFGHISGSHLHVNILPNNLQEYQLGYQLLEKWAKETIGQREVLFQEHGVGKLNKSF